MSIAGVVFPSGGSPVMGLQESLRFLAYSPSNPFHTQLLDQAEFGSVNEAEVGGLSLGTFAGCLVAFDGQLFSTGSPGSSVSSVSYAERIALAYREWGELFPLHLDGEFAAAVWDPEARRLLLARDAMGRGILHYCLEGNRLYFASEPRGLRHWPGLSAGEIDDTAVARMLSAQAVRGTTLFRGIRRLPGGSILTWSPGEPQVRVHNYWQPQHLPQLRVKDPREYAEALRAAMVRALRKRLPQSGIVASQMSAGLDSSSVTALAAQLLAKEGRGLIAYTSSPVHQVNAADLHRGRFGDEWPLASKVAAMYPNIEHVRIATNQDGLWESLDEMSDGWGFPFGFLRNARWHHGLFRNARERGAAVMLEGCSGNLTGSYSAAYGLYDLRRRGHWIKLAQAMRRRHRAGSSWRGLVYNAWLPSLRTVGLISRIRKQKAASLWDRTLMRPEFYAATGLPAKKLSSIGHTIEGDRTNGSSWRSTMLQITESGMPGAAMMRTFRVQRVDPTADRELAELCLSIPDEAFAPEGVPRDLYRNAMRNDLPQELLSERRRGLQGSDTLELIRESAPLLWEEWERLTQSPIAQRVFDLDRMRRMLDDLPRDTKSPAEMDVLYDYTLGGAIAAGRFLRRIESGEANT